MIVSMLLGHTGARCRVETVVDLSQAFSFVRAELAADTSSDYLVYVFPLRGNVLFRIWQVMRLGRLLRHVSPLVASYGWTQVGVFGVDPDVDFPTCIYECGTAAALYSDQNLRSRGRAQALRRLIAYVSGYDPSLGGVVLLIGRVC